LITKLHQDHLKQCSATLTQLVRLRTAELEASRREVILCLARAAEYRDEQTGYHVVRVGKYAAVIGRQLGMDEKKVESLELAAQLHDVGKIGVSDAILLKPGKLDPDEFAQMQKHCAFGKTIIQPLADNEWQLLRKHAEIGKHIMSISSSPIMQLAAVIALTHHERWDGSGYPLGLAGKDIPIEGRITAVADVYDALTSSRPYKPALSHQESLRILKEACGSQFDPTVLDAFLACAQEIMAIQAEYSD
jgi:putative two-component system response regulator